MFRAARPLAIAGVEPGHRGPDARCGRSKRARRSTAIIEILDAEIASRLLACFILDCCILLTEQRRRIQPSAAAIAQLTAARQEARRLQRVFDPGDSVVVRRILEDYGPRVPPEL